MGSMATPQNAVELLQALIRIPSVNPEGDPGTAHTGEQAIAEWLVAWLRREFPAARVELRDVLPGRPNVVACFGTGDGKKPRLLFAPHTDTVSVGGMTIAPFGGELRDGRVWGRGASDTKGTMAAMLWALRESQATLPNLGHEVWFAGLCSEEAGQHGARVLAEQERFDFVLAGEPTGLDAVVALKGALWLTLTTRGRAVHAAEPERGENAINKMADVLRCVRDELPADLGTAEHPLLGRATVSTGTIAGGSKINIVPDSCTAGVDIRYLPGDETIFERVTRRLRSVCPDLEIEESSSRPMITDPSHPMIRILEKCGSRSIGAPWFSDAGVFSVTGTPSIAIGPGSIAQAHTRDEWISVADLEKGVEFFQRFLSLL
jgi:acetylornithine deacetylase/succinyl-diaminopimelate desuccinylase-like protein